MKTSYIISALQCTSNAFAQKTITNKTPSTMKKIFTLLFALICGNVIAQTLTYADFNSGIKPIGPWTSYQSKYGTIYNVGDTLILGNPSGGRDFIYITNTQGFGATMAAINGSDPNEFIKPVSANARNSKSIIKKIYLGGSKREGYKVMIGSKGMMGSLSSTYSIDFENALEYFEIKSNIFSSDDALTDLKRAKEKLDLGLITPEQYDSIKLVLGKYIK